MMQTRETRSDAILSFPFDTQANEKLSSKKLERQEVFEVYFSLKVLSLFESHKTLLLAFEPRAFRERLEKEWRVRLLHVKTSIVDDLEKLKG